MRPDKFDKMSDTADLPEKVDLTLFGHIDQDTRTAANHNTSRQTPKRNEKQLSAGSIEIPVLLPGEAAEEKKTMGFPAITQTAKNFEMAKSAIARVRTMSMTGEQMVDVCVMNDAQSNALGQEKITMSGTGFLITPDGWMVTNSHVLFHGRLVAHLADGRKLPTMPYYADARSDIALVKVFDPEEKPLPYLKMRFTREPRKNETLTAIGHSNGWVDLHCSPGNLKKIGLRRDVCDNKGVLDSITIMDPKLKVYQTDCHIEGGNSGSPVLDRKGNVIGVIFAKQQDATEKVPHASVVIPADEIRKAILRVPELKKHFDPGGDYHQ